MENRVLFRINLVVYTFVIAMTFFVNPASATLSCSSLIKKIIPYRIGKVLGSGELIFKKMDFDPTVIDGSQVKAINNFLAKFTEKEIKYFLDNKEIIHQELRNLKKPYSLTFNLSKLSDKPYLEVLRFFKFLGRLTKNTQDWNEINNWIKSDEHALYAYDQLSKSGLDKHQNLLEFLIVYNTFFGNSFKVSTGGKSSLITYSLEKESTIADITLWYKDPKFTDNQWLKLSEADRLDLLKKATNRKKKFLNELQVAPTSFKPDFVSGYSEELETATNKNYGWEVSNKAFEVNLDKISQQIKELVDFTGETHSFHTHLVFHLKRKYKRFMDFTLWTKHVNDYLYLRGMEEGLHGTDLTGLASLPGHRFENSRRLPRRLEQIGIQTHKFFSMGVRGYIYGESSLDNHVKVGLELRDVSRSTDKTEEYLLELSSSISDFRWENHSFKKIDITEVGLLKNSRKMVSRSLKGKFSRGFIRMLNKSKSNISLALLPYESYKYLNYRNGEYRITSEAERMRIKSAREKFILELKKVEKEFLADKWKRKFSVEDYTSAIHYDLTVWAKEAKISEFFRDF